MSQGNNQHFNQILNASVKNVDLNTKLLQKRQDLILSCATGSPELQDQLRRECHDLLDLMLDNECNVVKNVVDELRKKLD